MFVFLLLVRESAEEEGDYVEVNGPVSRLVERWEEGLR